MEPSPAADALAEASRASIDSAASRPDDRRKYIASASSVGARPVSPDRAKIDSFSPSTSPAVTPAKVCILVNTESKVPAAFTANPPSAASGRVTLRVSFDPTSSNFLESNRPNPR